MHDGITCHMENGTMYHETRRDAGGTVHWGQSVMAYSSHLPLFPVLLIVISIHSFYPFSAYALMLVLALDL